MRPYSMYLLLCADGTLYCGSTNDVPRRLSVHNSGKGAKYTKSRLPVTLVYCEECGEKGDALRREAEIKKLKRAEKLALVEKYLRKKDPPRG